ncbi:hypothetical protein ACFRJ9_14530 [Paenarthrobacter sp. NPDC056912]|uniref:hypothetical protein n=1 Tax=Paenarthrobacter sp. NPDC056912 TaxID=3345965 RepID=UPI00366CE801
MKPTSRLRIEVYGTKGALTFDLQILNELQFLDATAQTREHGFRRILVNGNQPPLPFDAAALKDAKPRQLTQAIAAWLYERIVVDGGTFGSRHGDDSRHTSVNSNDTVLVPRDEREPSGCHKKTNGGASKRNMLIGRRRRPATRERSACQSRSQCKHHSGPALVPFH